MLEKTLGSPLVSKEIKPVNPKGNQHWIFIGRTDAEAEAPKLWPLDAKSQLTGKDPDAGKDGRQEEKEMTEDEMVGWHHWLYGHEFEQTPEDSEGQGSQACCSPWRCKELDMTDLVTEQKQSMLLQIVFNVQLSSLVGASVPSACICGVWTGSTAVLPQCGAKANMSSGSLLTLIFQG